MSETLTLLTRPGCPLCDEMEAEIGHQLSDSRHRLVTIDVDADTVLKARYGWDVPVLFGGKTEICRHRMNLSAFREWLRAHP